jgi:hypothetical protein
MPLPSSSQLWPHINQTKGPIIEDLGGNIKGLGNYCAVRLSYALIKCGHPIQINSDYKDKNGNKYIIKTKTVENYLNDYYKGSQKINSINGLSGIVYFKDCGFGDASGHVDVIVNGKVADKDFSDKASQILFWQC